MAEELGIQGAAAMAAAGEWEALSRAIEETKQQQIEDAIQANNSVLQGQNRKSLMGEEWFNGSAKDDGQTAYANAIQNGFGPRNEDGKSYIGSLIKDYKDIDKENIPGLIKRTKENLEALAKEEEKLNQASDEEKGTQA